MKRKDIEKIIGEDRYVGAPGAKYGGLHSGLARIEGIQERTDGSGWRGNGVAKARVRFYYHPGTKDEVLQTHERTVPFGHVSTTTRETYLENERQAEEARRERAERIANENHRADNLVERINALGISAHRGGWRVAEPRIIDLDGWERLVELAEAGAAVEHELAAEEEG